MLQKRFLLLMLMLIAIISTISCISLFWYFDPYTNIALGFSLLFVSLFLSITSSISIVLYFCKKIYFRGEVYVYNVISSVRQSAFLALCILSTGVLMFMGFPLIIPIILIAIMLLFLELFIRSIS